MTMYLNEPDHAGHEGGPDSEKVSAHIMDRVFWCSAACVIVVGKVSCVLL